MIQVGSVPLVDNLPAEAKSALDSAIEIVPGTNLDDALTQVKNGEAAAVLQQQGDTLELNFSSAQPVGRGAVQGVFSSFVDAGQHRRLRAAADLHAGDRSRWKTNPCNRSSTSPRA